MNQVYVNLSWSRLFRCLDKRIFLAALVGLPTILSAQIVSNTGEAKNSIWGINGALVRAANFTTGSNAGGYTLTSIAAPFTAADAGASGFQADIYSDNSNSPNASVETLTGSDPTTTGSHTFNSAGLSLDANTTYWVVFSASNTGFYRWDNTSSDSETSSDGWTIGDHLTSSVDSGASWNVDDNTLAPQFSVQATAVPEPHEYAMLVGFGLVGFVAVRRRLQAPQLA